MAADSCRNSAPPAWLQVQPHKVTAGDPNQQRHQAPNPGGSGSAPARAKVGGISSRHRYSEQDKHSRSFSADCGGKQGQEDFALTSVCTAVQAPKITAFLSSSGRARAVYSLLFRSCGPSEELQCQCIGASILGGTGLQSLSGTDTNKPNSFPGAARIHWYDQADFSLRSPLQCLHLHGPHPSSTTHLSPNLALSSKAVSAKDWKG